MLFLSKSAITMQRTDFSEEVFKLQPVQVSTWKQNHASAMSVGTHAHTHPRLLHDELEKQDPFLAP